MIKSGRRKRKEKRGNCKKKGRGYWQDEEKRRKRGRTGVL